ncbi:hypothetical protein SORBI_3002G154551 [Sorghum bicolor]|nr:hypothetical protein SORBI_3002G154551 [Sorghum bicolor]OQU89169.1 hypothetical protein SORBI_3002G154551 [Sorghum bicolor]
MEHIEQIAHEIENLKKKLAWAWVYNVDKKIGKQEETLEKLKERIPACQERIDRNTAIIEELRKEFIVKEENFRSFLEKTREARRMKEKMDHDICEEYFEKASTICAETEVEALGGVDGSIEQLSACITKLKQKIQQESRRYTETIDNLRALHDKKGQKILRKQQIYAGFRDKLNACQKALDLRWMKFQRNAGLLKRQLTWLFNEHLGKKGISGHINVDYKNEVLSVELTMPQDASRDTIRDTRGLSGGERSFSTLCFTLSLHGMTEAPFRAMDEFDVFM